MREPAIVIGLIGTIIVGALTSIGGSGLIDGKGLVLVNDLITVIPLVFAALIRQIVTPVAAPVLPEGTLVNKGAAFVASRSGGR